MGQRGVRGEDGTTIRENPCFLPNNAVATAKTRYSYLDRYRHANHPTKSKSKSRILYRESFLSKLRSTFQAAHERASSETNSPRRCPISYTRYLLYTRTRTRTARTYPPIHPSTQLPQLHASYTIQTREAIMASEPTAASGAEQNFAASQTSEGEETLSPLEQEVLDEYARLLGNLNNVSFSTYPNPPTPSHPHPPSSFLHPSLLHPSLLHSSQIIPAYPFPFNKVIV